MELYLLSSVSKVCEKIKYETNFILPHGELWRNLIDGCKLYFLNSNPNSEIWIISQVPQQKIDAQTQLCPTEKGIGTEDHSIHQEQGQYLHLFLSFNFILNVVKEMLLVSCVN